MIEYDISKIELHMVNVFYKVFNIQKLNSYESELVLKNKIYILQKLTGMQILYPFKWEMQSIWSEEFHKCFISEDRKNMYPSNGYDIKEDIIPYVNKINSLDDKNPDDLSLVDWYNLLGCISYIDNMYLKGYKHSDKNKWEIFKKIVPFYTKKHYKHAVLCLKKIGLSFN